MRHHIPALVLTLLMAIPFQLLAQKYQYDIDLQNVKDDKVKITLTPPKLKGGKAIFVMPSVIPGSYSRKNYGRFIENFKAYDQAGKELKVKLKKESNFYIKGASKLAKIEYWVNDTWDHEDKDHWVFQPGGSNIEAGKNFSINHHAFFGYFEGYKQLPYELTFSKPANMYGSTPLKKKEVNKETDILYADNYVKLVDNPVMYCEPDTVSFMAGNTKVFFSVYSPLGVVSANQIADYNRPLGSALSNFFGTLPVDQYHFILYFAGADQQPYVDPNAMAGFGALEHSYCSFYYLPEIGQDMFLKPLIQDVSAHEFLHILTPLNIHSEEIEDFNFRKPKMSQHLWMYEGVTEYFAMLVQVRDQIIDEEEFRNKVREKINQADEFENISFTKMSKQILKEKYQAAYLNVYQKGALIGLALDLRLTELSKGTYGLKELMMDLASKYGPNKPFKDKELVNTIVQMTYPEIRDFFNQYVIGDKRIDYNKFFNIVGWEYITQATREGFSFGSMQLGYDPEAAQFMFVNVQDNTLNIQENDKLLKINGEEITIENVQDIVTNKLASPQNANNIDVIVLRDNKEVKLQGTPQKSTQTITNSLEALANPTPQQLKYRKFLLSQ